MSTPVLKRVKRRVNRYMRTVNQWRGVMDPNEVAAHGSEAELRAFTEIARKKHLDGYRIRVALMEDLEKERFGQRSDCPDGSLRLPDIPKDAGILLVRPEQFPLLDEALAEARENFRGYVPGTNKRQYDSLQGVPRRDRTYTSAINRLATHPEVLRVVSNYLGMLPILHRINLLYSPNDEEVELSSQYFHLDPGDLHMMKIFVFVEDVDAETGPTTALPAARSLQVGRAIDYRNTRVPDEVIARLGGTENLVECVGPAGTMAFLDTCGCFHMGSRRASKPRAVIMIQYQSPYTAPSPLDGPLPTPPVGDVAIPPNPSIRDQYLFGLQR